MRRRSGQVWEGGGGDGRGMGVEKGRGQINNFTQIIYITNRGQTLWYEPILKSEMHIIITTHGCCNNRKCYYINLRILLQYKLHITSTEALRINQTIKIFEIIITSLLQELIWWLKIKMKLLKCAINISVPFYVVISFPLNNVAKFWVANIS